MSFQPLPSDHPAHPLNLSNTLSLSQSQNDLVGNPAKALGSDLANIIDFTLEELQFSTENNSILEDAKKVYTPRNLYDEADVSNPEELNPIKSQQQATNMMMGYSKKLEGDLLNWQKGLSKEGQETFSVMTQVLPSTGVMSLEPLIKELELSYRAIAALASSLSMDYDSGNSFEQVNNIKQFNVGQFRVVTSNITSFNTPVLFTGSRETILQTEHNFLQADISHNTVKNFWLRAEWSENYCSLRRNSYIIDEDISYCANKVDFCGGRQQYSDGFEHEIGKMSFQRLHPLRSRGNYGSCSTTSLANQTYKSRLGSIKTNAMFNVSISSLVGVVLINSFGIGSFIKAGVSAVGSALSAPTQMSDPPELEKIDFSQPASNSYSINNSTPFGLNTDIGKGSGAYKGSYGSEGSFANFNWDQLFNSEDGETEFTISEESDVWFE